MKTLLANIAARFVIRNIGLVEPRQLKLLKKQLEGFNAKKMEWNFVWQEQLPIPKHNHIKSEFAQSFVPEVPEP